MLVGIVVKPVAVRAQDPRDARATQLVDVDFTLSGSYDTDASLETPTAGLGDFQPAGYAGLGIASLEYLRRFSANSNLQANATSALRYYPGVNNFKNLSHAAGLGLATGLPARLTLQITENVSYSPAYLYTLFPDLPTPVEDNVIAPPTDYEYDVDSSSSYTSATSIALSRQLGRRSSISAEGNLLHADFSQESALRRDLTTYSLAARFSRNLTRNNILTTSYTYSVGQYAYDVNANVAENKVDVGLDLNRPVSATQRMQFFFHAGASIVQLPEALTDIDVGDRVVNTQTVDVSGEAGMAYPFGGWELRGSYTRGLQYVPAVTRPLFVDGFSGEISGSLARRFGILGRVRRSSGQSIVSENGLIDAYTAQARISVPLSRQLEAYSEYLYYSYVTDSQVPSPVIPIILGLPPDLKRHSITVGLKMRIAVDRR
jgi:hypothetical protein